MHQAPNLTEIGNIILISAHFFQLSTRIEIISQVERITSKVFRW
jgi:hypothetical protein